MNVSMPSARFAAILTSILGIGALFFALLLFALARSGLGRIDLPNVGSVLDIIAVLSTLYGLVAVGTAVGLWRAAGWAVAIGAVVHALALIGILIAAETGGVGPHIAAGTFLTVAGLLALTPSLRSTASSGRSAGRSRGSSGRSSGSSGGSVTPQRHSGALSGAD